jgi:hypothetical protein
MPVRLKIDIGDGAVTVIDGHQNEAAVAGFGVGPLGGPRLRGPRPHLGGRVTGERHLPDRAEEDIGEIGRVTRIVDADGDFHPATVVEAREQAAQKYRCPICVLLLPWTHDVLDSLEAKRLHKSVFAARCCPEHEDGCHVGLQAGIRQPPQGQYPGAVFIFLGMSQRIGARSPKPGKCGFNSCHPCAAPPERERACLLTRP